MLFESLKTKKKINIILLIFFFFLQRKSMKNYFTEYVEFLFTYAANLFSNDILTFIYQSICKKKIFSELLEVNLKNIVLLYLNKILSLRLLRERSSNASLKKRNDSQELC